MHDPLSEDPQISRSKLAYRFLDQCFEILSVESVSALKGLKQLFQ